MSSRSPAKLTFRIGGVLPADDVVARFLTGVAMSTNDLIRVQSIVVREQEPGMRLLLFRLDAAYVWETSLFVRDRQL